jgi:hypothetical protein
MTNPTVLVHRTMSLDGFIAGPEHEMGHPGKPTSRPYDIAPVLLGEGIAFSPARAASISS